MTRNRLIRGMAALLLATVLAGSLASHSPGDWQGWSWDPSLRQAENAFGFLGAVLSKIVVAFLGRWAGLAVTVSLLLLLAWREFFSLRLRRALIPWGGASLLLLLWSGWLVRGGRMELLATDWGGWLGALLAEGQEGLLGRTGATILPAFLTLLGLLALMPAPRRRRFSWLRLPDFRPLLRGIAAPIRWLAAGLRWIWRILSGMVSGLGRRLAGLLRDWKERGDSENMEKAIATEQPHHIPEERAYAAAASSQSEAGTSEADTGDRPAPRPMNAKPKAKAKARRSGEYLMPASDLLLPPEESTAQTDRRQLEEMARVLVDKLATFNIGGRVSAMKQGPVVSTFEYEPEDGVKVSQITGRREDLALALRSKELRLVAPIPGKAAVGIELPNRSPRIIRLREVLDAESYAGKKGDLALALGVDVDGRPTWADLSAAPHLLVAGATGTGKSVCINGILVSLLLQHTPETLRLFLVDPKMLELSIYNEIPHLLHPVITDNKMALQALNWLVGEMESRYRRLKPSGVRSLGEYNDKVREGKVTDAEG